MLGMWPQHTLGRSSLCLKQPRAEDDVIYWESSRASWVPEGGEEEGESWPWLLANASPALDSS